MPLRKREKDLWHKEILKFGITKSKSELEVYEFLKFLIKMAYQEKSFGEQLVGEFKMLQTEEFDTATTTKIGCYY